MRRVRYHVATSLDGYIAGPNGEFDWIVMDPSVDFDALFAEFDAFVMGRNTFELVQSQGPDGPLAGKRVIVCSNTLAPEDYPGVTIVSRGATEMIREMKKKPGKDIWLFGGGILFRSFLDAGLVDTIEVAVTPILLSQGVPVLPKGERSPALKLTSSRTLPSGIVMLTYTL